MANTVLEEDVSSGKVGAHRRVLGGVRGQTLEKLAAGMENME